MKRADLIELERYLAKTYRREAMQHGPLFVVAE